LTSVCSVNDHRNYVCQEDYPSPLLTAASQARVTPSMHVKPCFIKVNLLDSCGRFFQAGCRSCRPTNGVKTPKESVGDRQLEDFWPNQRRSLGESSQFRRSSLGRRRRWRPDWTTAGCDARSWPPDDRSCCCTSLAFDLCTAQKHTRSWRSKAAQKLHQLTRITLTVTFTVSLTATQCSTCTALLQAFNAHSHVTLTSDKVR